MNDYSLELAAERISDARTRRYFSEVMQSYNSGCFRSSVVMLWSVAVCDILFKLTQLADSFGDLTAKGILKDIEYIRVANPKSPEWEWELIEQVKTRTQLLEAGDYANLEALRQHRHLSAHPVLSAAEVLFEPNRETARAHIRNTLDGVLTKPAIMTKKVFDALVEDLEINASIFADKLALSKYLSAKYLAHMVPAIEIAIFRSLWRLVFKSEDLRCETNRTTNFRALTIIYERNREGLKTAISNERSYFSEVGPQGSRLDLLIRFIGSHPELYPLLTDAAKTPLEAASKTSLTNFAVCTFLSKDLQTHIRAVEARVKKKEYIGADAFGDLLEIAQQQGLEPLALNLAITQFGMSNWAPMADGYFTSLIFPSLGAFSKEHLTQLVGVVNSNRQIHARSRAKKDHLMIKEMVQKAFGIAFDFSKYPKFVESLESAPKQPKAAEGSGD